jgi:hypothetical protein
MPEQRAGLARPNGLTLPNQDQVPEMPLPEPVIPEIIQNAEWRAPTSGPVVRGAEGIGEELVPIASGSHGVPPPRRAEKIESSDNHDFETNLQSEAEHTSSRKRPTIHSFDTKPTSDVPVSAGVPPETSAGIATNGHERVSLPGSTPETAGGDLWYQLALASFLSNLATLIVGLISFSGLFLFLVRRCGGFPLVIPRPEFPPRGEYGDANFQANLAIGCKVLAESDRPTKLDLGPTYAEELRMREEAARQQEEAVLRQLFEQNLHLREQIGALQTASTA